MPDYLSDYYTILSLDEEATYQDVLQRHALLIQELKDNPSSGISEAQINLAKDRLAKLLHCSPWRKIIIKLLSQYLTL